MSISHTLSAGHSLGAGLATLAFLHMLSDNTYCELHTALGQGGVYTFGCPNVVASGGCTRHIADAVKDFCRNILHKER